MSSGRPSFHVGAKGKTQGRDGKTGKEEKKKRKKGGEVQPEATLRFDGPAGGSVLCPPTHSDGILFTFSATLDARRRDETVADVHVNQRLATAPHLELSEGHAALDI